MIYPRSLTLRNAALARLRIRKPFDFLYKKLWSFRHFCGFYLYPSPNPPSSPLKLRGGIEGGYKWEITLTQKPEEPKL
jgi:hypothetical protein